MSYHLTLIPVEPQSFRLNVSILSPRLTMPSGDYRIIGQIFDLSFRRATEPDVTEHLVVRSQELPCEVLVETLQDDRIVSTSTTKFGDPYRITTVRELKKIVLPPVCDPYDRAAKAYIDQLPDHWQVVVELS